jgi:hypothetical protein
MLPAADTLFHPLVPGGAVRHWRHSAVSERRYDVADRPMAGEMDPFFFLTKHKNFIPHEYPCRTAFAAARRDRRPEPWAAGPCDRVWLPFGAEILDLSGFWFRPTEIAAWAETGLDLAAAGTVRLRLTTCGGAVLFVDGEERGHLAAYVRNLETAVEIALPLAAGRHAIRVHLDDLAERDTRFVLRLDYLDGPPARVAVPVPVAAERAAALEPLLDGLRFDRAFYTAGDVALVLPAPAPFDLDVRVSVAGDFISADRTERDGRIGAGADRFVVGTVDDLPPECRSYTVTLADGPYAVRRTLAVEVTPLARQGDAPARLADRVAEALDHVAEQAEPDSVRALARLATGRGGADTDAMLLACLPAIRDCHDCADFLLVPMLWCRLAYADALAPATRAAIDDAVRGYRYWMDEPGNDVQWYFSENHALLFHTAAYLAGTLLPDARFVRSGRTGAEQAAVGAARLAAWLDAFAAHEMAEWNSTPYFPIDFKGLAALVALAPDPGLRDRARAAILRLVEIIARSAHHGVVTASQGRSYEHTLRPARTAELNAVARLLFGTGQLGRRFHCLPQLALLLRDHGLEIPADLAAIARMEEDGAREWRFAQGPGRIARLYHYKCRDYAMGSIAAYRPGEWGYQETVLQLRLGRVPEAQVFVNHPGEIIQSGSGRPSFWGGCGTLPRVHQYRAVALVDFDVADGQPDFTHAFLPFAAFDHVEIAENRILLAAGDGFALLVGSAPFEVVAAGPSAGCEVRLPGRRGRWLIRLGSAARDGGGRAGLAAFGDRMAALGVAARGGARRAERGYDVVDPDYGAITFHASGVVDAGDRRLDPAEWTIRGETTCFPTA